MACCGDTTKSIGRGQHSSQFSGPRWTKEGEQHGKPVFSQAPWGQPHLSPKEILIDGDVESNPGPSGKCLKCENPFRKGSAPITCSTCGERYHKTTCTGETRYKMDRIVREGVE